MPALLRILVGFPLLILSPFLILIPFAALILCDLAWFLAGRRRSPSDTRPNADAASVVIPNWNGRDLLKKYLPSVVEALLENSRNEIIIVDNGSSDGSVDYLKTAFPEVKVVALPENLGFGRGSN